MKLSRFTVTLLSLAILIFSCKSSNKIKPEDDYNLALMQIEKLHLLYNEENFEEIVDTLYSSGLVKIGNKNEIIESLKYKFQRFGKVIDSKISNEYGTALTPNTQRREVTITAKTQFENKLCPEVFVFFVDDEVKLALHRVKDYPSKSK
ncbi:MAG TPA: hypothetical protein PKE69_22170 [Pyrinomonadaceae bacterium]|nr:hypothetical protein [Pyrinomonadaceae bacterium]